MSCGVYVPLTDEVLEQAQNHRFRAGPEEAADAAVEAFEETDNPFGMHIERTSKTSALAERTAMLCMPVSSSITTTAASRSRRGPARTAGRTRTRSYQRRRGRFSRSRGAA